MIVEALIIFVGLFWIGLVIDIGLTNIANSVRRTEKK